MKISIVADERQMRRALSELSHIKNGAGRAMASALNRTLTGLKSDAAKEVRNSYIIQHKDVLRVLKTTKATKTKLVAELKGTYDKISLSKFRVTPKRTIGVRPKKGLKVTVKKNEGGRMQHGFIATVGGGVQVFTRKGKDRLPIKKHFGPAVVQMLASDEVDAKIQRQAQERLNKNMAHEIDRILQGHGSGRGKVSIF